MFLILGFLPFFLSSNADKIPIVVNSPAVISPIEVPSFLKQLPANTYPQNMTERTHPMENHTISVGEHATPSNSPTRPRKKTHTQMRVKKRNGSFESVDLNKIVKAIDRCCEGLDFVDTMRVATRTISGLYDGATTSELDELSIQTAASFMAEEPEYSFLASRLLSNYIDK